MSTIREKVEEKGLFRKEPVGLWKITCGTETFYRITDDGCGFCNSVEELSPYYNGDEIGLVSEILKRGNKILFENVVSGAEATHEEYLEQFKSGEDFPIVPYVNFKSYEKAKEI